MTLFSLFAHLCPVAENPTADEYRAKCSVSLYAGMENKSLLARNPPRCQLTIAFTAAEFEFARVSSKNEDAVRIFACVQVVRVVLTFAACFFLFAAQEGAVATPKAIEKGQVRILRSLFFPLLPAM